ncbi:MAG: GNAT family N-acetyltransferase [Desulfobacteraceae bacterium]|nr:MAG: GNAT family N-acetyltransferase [Desulfobacteraceae bacterium]
MRLPLCVRIDADDKRSADALKADGWREIETLEVWGAELNPSGQISHYARQAVKGDNLRCQQIAQKACVFDRLHRDEKVDPCDADEFKRTEVNEAFTNRLNDVIVYQNGGQVQGFIIVRLEYLTIHVDLIAVDPSHAKKGIGKDLLFTAICVNGARQRWVRAGTQGHNVPARALYKSCGLSILSRYRTWHK